MLRKTVSIFLIGVFAVACSGNKRGNTFNTKNSTSKEDLIDANRVLVKKDRQRIKGAIKRKGWEMEETETGFWFEEIEQGTGASAREGLIVTINYTISLLDGTLCYSTDMLGAKTFEIGRGGVETGLEQAILLCKEGTKARFILPPYLAYGLPGDGDKIPARAIIVYEIEVLKISNKE